jgi:hypothetical protein
MRRLALAFSLLLPTACAHDDGAAAPITVAVAPVHAGPETFGPADARQALERIEGVPYRTPGGGSSSARAAPARDGDEDTRVRRSSRTGRSDRASAATMNRYGDWD